MGVAQAPRITQSLLARLPADLPAAVVQHASTPQERRAVATLGTLVHTLQTQGFGSPAVLVVGRVLDAPATACWPAEVTAQRAGG